MLGTMGPDNSRKVETKGILNSETTIYRVCRESYKYTEGLEPLQSKNQDFLGLSHNPIKSQYRVVTLEMLSSITDSKQRERGLAKYCLPKMHAVSLMSVSPVLLISVLHSRILEPGKLDEDQSLARTKFQRIVIQFTLLKFQGLHLVIASGQQSFRHHKALQERSRSCLCALVSSCFIEQLVFCGGDYLQS